MAKLFLFFEKFSLSIYFGLLIRKFTAKLFSFNENPCLLMNFTAKSFLFSEIIYLDKKLVNHVTLIESKEKFKELIEQIKLFYPFSVWKYIKSNDIEEKELI